MSAYDEVLADYIAESDAHDATVAELEATETALHVACDRIMRADAELRFWRVMAGANAAVAGLALASMWVLA